MGASSSAGGKSVRTLWITFWAVWISAKSVAFGRGAPAEFSVAVPFVAVPAYFVPDEMAQVATEVKGEDAHGVREAGKPLPQEAVGGGLDFLGKGVQVPRENMPDVLQVLGRFGLIHAANFVKSPLSKWGA